MKKAHLFSLKVSFKDGHKWDLKIVACDIAWLFCYVSNDQKELISSFNAELLQGNYANVTKNFGSSDWTEELEQDQKRWKTINL